MVEEFFFRKAFWQVLSAVSGSRVLSRVLYIGLSSFVFGLGHWASGSQAVFQAFAVGILLAVSYVKLRRLAPLVIGHCLADVVLFV